MKTRKAKERFRNWQQVVKIWGRNCEALSNVNFGRVRLKAK